MQILKFGLCVAAVNLVGCASIVNGTNQSVSVETRNGESSLSGASCTLTNDKGKWFLTSPGSMVVSRSYEDLSVKCEKEPLAPGVVTAKSSTKAMAFGNIIFGGFIGAGVDMATGAAYDYPPMLSVVMGKSVLTPAPAAPTAAERKPQPGDADCVLMVGRAECEVIKAPLPTPPTSAAPVVTAPTIVAK